jgi:hypothetical protein
MKALIVFPGAAALAALWQPANAQAPSAEVHGAMAPAPSAPAATAALTTLQQVCLPLLQGQTIKAVSSSTGLKKKDGQWVLPVAGDQDVALNPPDLANPHVCSAVIPHRPGSGDAIFASLDGWAKAQAPPLSPDKVRVQSAEGDEQVTTSSWTGQTPKGAEALVLADTRSVSGQAAGALDKATLLVSLAPS